MKSAVSKTALLLCAGLLAAGPSAYAQSPESPPEAPHAWRYDTSPSPPPRWAAELKAGSFDSDLDEWDRFYDDDDIFALALGYKPWRMVEIGLEMGQISTSGAGQLPITGDIGGEVDFRLRPAHLYLLWRGVYSENQTFVPYAGGGATRVFYRQSVPNQPSREGDVDGSHWRAGIQLLLDRVDEPLADEGDRNMGINNTYLFIEKQSFSADIDGVDLGGETTFIGILVEF